MEDTNNTEKYPSVELAYEFVIPSYELARSRLESVERRIEGLLTYIATITLAIPVVTIAIAKESGQLDVLGWQAVGALSCFAAATLLGMVGRQVGEITLVDPTKLYEKTLSYTHWEFQKNAIYFAGEHFEKNRSLIACKSRLGDIMVGLLVAEAIFGLLWAHGLLSA